jgi:hypothetical protein
MDFFNIKKRKAKKAEKKKQSKNKYYIDDSGSFFADLLDALIFWRWFQNPITDKTEFGNGDFGGAGSSTSFFDDIEFPDIELPDIDLD